MDAWQLDLNDIFRWRPHNLTEWQYWRVTETLPRLKAQPRNADGSWGKPMNFNEYATVEKD
jgi:hypothetical protein